MKIHITHNEKTERILKLEDHGAVKLFDFRAPNDFATRSIWEVVDSEKFEEARKSNNEFVFYLASEEYVKGFEKFKLDANQLE